MRHLILKGIVAITGIVAWFLLTMWLMREWRELLAFILPDGLPERLRSPGVGIALFIVILLLSAYCCFRLVSMVVNALEVSISQNEKRHERQQELEDLEREIRIKELEDKMRQRQEEDGEED